MTEEDAIAKLLLIYKQTKLVTRPEVGLMIGKSVGSIAGICHRKSIVGWPDVTPEFKQLRTCCFLVSPLSKVIPSLCGNKIDKTADPDGFVCTEHTGLSS
jgi:hypothetical protein